MYIHLLQNVVLIYYFKFEYYDLISLFIGKLSDIFDVTIAMKSRDNRDKFLADVQVLFEFRQSRHFIKVVAAVYKSEPHMIVLGETVKYTLQNYLKTDAGETITFTDLTRMASEVFIG